MPKGFYKEKIEAAIAQASPRSYPNKTAFFRAIGIRVNSGFVCCNEHPYLAEKLKQIVKLTAIEQIKADAETIPDKQYQSVSELARDYGVTPQGVSQACKRDRELRQICDRIVANSKQELGRCLFGDHLSTKVTGTAPCCPDCQPKYEEQRRQNEEWVQRQRRELLAIRRAG